MEIHGSDIIIDTKIPVKPDLVQLLLKDHWPNVVFEFDESEKENGDFFAYENEEAKKAWNAGSAGSDKDMIYVLFRKDFKEITFVIDDFKCNQYIVDDIVQFIRKCE